MKRTKVLAVIGPTAAGKSALALEMTRELYGEIVCMDSMQIYRGMDIGSAKPTGAEQAETPHHMLDIVEPFQAFSVADYVDRAEPILHEIASRGRLPILVGGTGLYLRALLEGMPLGGVKSDESVRGRLWAIAEEPKGKERLHEMLAEVDPQTAARIHPNDLRRAIRALEVYEITGLPISGQNEVSPDRPFSFCLIGATMERESLYARIDERVEQMMASGLLGEVESLLGRGVPPSSQAMQGIGYKELIPVLEAGLPLAEAVELIKRNTRRYAKRQWTWFCKEEGVIWIDMLEESAWEKAMERASRFWQGQSE